MAFTEMPTVEISEARKKWYKWVGENASKRKNEIIDTCFPVVENQENAYVEFAEELERLSKSRQSRDSLSLYPEDR